MNFETDLCTDHRRPFADLAALNFRFISLVIDSALTDSARVSGLDSNLCKKLAGLDERQVERLAGCPYALFDMHFAANDFWDLAPLSTVADGFENRMQSFFLTALCFARDLACHHRELFFLFFGKSSETAQRLKERNIAALADIATRNAGRLSARLPQHPRFWPDLIDFVSDGSVAQYQAAKAVGMQLSAGQRPASCGRR